MVRALGTALAGAVVAIVPAARQLARISSPGRRPPTPRARCRRRSSSFEQARAELAALEGLDRSAAPAGDEGEQEMDTS